MEVPTSTQILDLAGFHAFRRLAVGNDGVGERQQFFELERPIEFTLGSGRLAAKPEAERARPVVRRIEQVIELTELRFARMFLDDAAAPIIRAGIAQRPEHAAERRRAVGALAQLQLERIDRHRIRTFEIAAAIDEASDRDPGAVRLQHETPRRHELRRVGKHNVDEALRSHCRAPRRCGRGHVRSRAQGSCLPHPAPDRRDQ